MKTTFAALALVIAPTLSLAEGCKYGHGDSASISCPAGQNWDSEAEACVPGTSS